MTPSELSGQYQALLPTAERLRQTLQDQLLELIRVNGVRLAVPLQTRVKTWESISEKLERKALQLEAISALDDLVGVRVILLFRRDLDAVADLIHSNLGVRQRVDTADRLKPSEFGYHSLHFVVQTPDTWNDLPTLRGCGALRAEIQVRTAAQHIWAEASHLLQYKIEDSVPVPVRRAINRVAALLETVDLEFERVLSERDKYRVAIKAEPQRQLGAPLNVDLLESILDAFFPEVNRGSDEPYEGLLADLKEFGIARVNQLTELLERHLDQLRAAEARFARDGSLWNTTERRAKGVFFSHAGLLRLTLNQEFGEKWRSHLLRKRAAKATEVQPSPVKRVQKRR